MKIHRRFLQCNGIDIHIRESGSTSLQTLILLHPTPLSSKLFEYWMPHLSSYFHVVALDTPGYGSSDPLIKPPNSIDDYVSLLHDAFCQVANGAFLLYGSATGAQLGIAYANTWPDKVAHLLLDNAAHFNDEERKRILDKYFPDLHAVEGGHHLLAAWNMASRFPIFFPWFETDETYRISHRTPMPAETNQLALEFLKVGPAYEAAYRVAFEHERVEHIQRVRIPTTIFRWKASILLKYIDRMLAFPMPPNVSVVNTPADLGLRYATMTEHLLSVTNQAQA